MHPLRSLTAEYALRATAWIAARSPDQPVLARDLSEGALIPQQYLSKILRRLVLAGILESRKGRGGGFTLGRPPGHITYREVLEAVGAHQHEDRCAFGWGACNASRPCPLHASWTSINAAFREWAATSTFADLDAWASARAARPPRPAAAAFARRRKR